MYKVVRKRNGCLTSVSMQLPSEFFTTYEPGTWHDAPYNSRFFIFEYIDDARKFANLDIGVFELWEVEAEDVVMQIFCADLCLALDTIRLAEEWDQGFMNWWPAPRGSLGARKVKLCTKLL